MPVEVFYRAPLDEETLARIGVGDIDAKKVAYWLFEDLIRAYDTIKGQEREIKGLHDQVVHAVDALNQTK